MRRPALLGAAWLAAAAAAVGLGFLAVSFVGASASPDASFLAAPGPASSGQGPTSSSQAPSVVTTARQVTPGGTVVASCTGGTAELAGAPAAGWWSEDPADRDAVEFSNGTQKVEVRATCPAGAPSFVVEGPGASPTSAGVPQSPATDDKGGQRGGGGGHGSDG